MATANVFSAERSQAIEDAAIVDASLVGDNLVLTSNDGTPHDVGNVRGAQGIQGIPGNPGANGVDAAFVVRASDPNTNLNLTGTQTIDGVALAVGDRVLAKNQTTSANNGIYVVAAGAWTRATDADSSAELAGAIVRVQQGTTNGGCRYTTSFKGTDTLGTTSMPWQRVLDGFNAAYITINDTTPDASGYVTVTHNLGWAPRMIFGMGANPGTRFAVLWGCDTITSTTFKARFMNASTAGALTTSGTGSFIFLCIR